MNAIGHIINSSTLTNFDEIGGATWVQNGNVIEVSGGTSGLYNDERLEFDYHSCLHHVNKCLSYKVKSKSTTTHGLGIGVRDEIGGRFCIINLNCTTGSDAGKIQLISNLGNVVFAQSTGVLSITVNDVVYLECERVGTLLKVQAVNLTQKTSIEFSYENTKNVGNNYIGNTAKFCVWQLGGTYDLLNFNVFSKQKKGNDILWVGDSMTLSSNATKYEYSYVNRIMSQKTDYTYAISAGGGDTTADVINKLPELLLLSRPNTTVCMLIGINDILQSVPEATSIANIRTVVDAFESENRVVILQNLVRHTTENVTSFNSALATEFGATNKIIDNSALFEGSGATPDAKYFSDTVHLNIWGHRIQGENILSGLGDHLKQ